LIFDDLRAIQRRYGYLPADQLQALSKKSGIALFQINSVADFYPHFYLTPQPKVAVRICTDMACHLRGADNLMADVKNRLQATGTKDVGVKECSCLGQCDGGPAIFVNDNVYRNVTVAQTEALILMALTGGELPELDEHHATPELASEPYPGPEKYGALRKLIQTRDWAGVIATLKASGLSGMGGAGFPTGVKWELVRNAAAEPKYVVCNADESEPGTIKDRFIMEHMPHLVIEGMIIAGLVTGAKQGIFYIRHEYTHQEHILDREIERCKQEGLLGSHILGTDLEFHLELFVSPGGYICGEESALIEAIEGKRSEPRNKPPFPVTEGLWHKPTALNNVETFSNVPQILARGVDWYKAQGLGGAAGLKIVGVSGDVTRPGIFEIPLGMVASEVILGLAGGAPDGKQVKAWAPSGPSSGYLPASMLNLRLDFKSMAAVGSMLGSGAIVVCAEGRCMLDMALNAVKFFRNESCGKCVPCRMGSQKMVDILTGWTRGKGTKEDFQMVDDLTEALKLTSICGLGQFAHSPISSVLQYFRDEVEAHVFEKRCPEGSCPMTDAAVLGASA
jgi:NADH:ubiquinone oxidoreductase subunit F (NADH-binding)/NADH:ubiquinone oxidoreductase subunit E